MSQSHYSSLKSTPDGFKHGAYCTSKVPDIVTLRHGCVVTCEKLQKNVKFRQYLKAPCEQGFFYTGATLLANEFVSDSSRTHFNSRYRACSVSTTHLIPHVCYEKRTVKTSCFSGTGLIMSQIVNFLILVKQIRGAFPSAQLCFKKSLDLMLHMVTGRVCCVRISPCLLSGFQKYVSGSSAADPKPVLLSFFGTQLSCCIVFVFALMLFLRSGRAQ